MYNMSINYHDYSVIALLVMIGLNFLLLFQAKNLLPYRKKMAFLIPTIAVTLAFILFTGTIMMAAKHLHFSLANIAMIVTGILFIILEVKRVKPLKHLKDLPQAIPLYRNYAKKILLIELSLILGISFWMWL